MRVLRARRGQRPGVLGHEEGVGGEAPEEGLGMDLGEMLKGRAEFEEREELVLRGDEDVGEATVEDPCREGGGGRYARGSNHSLGF